MDENLIIVKGDYFQHGSAACINAKLKFYASGLIFVELDNNTSFSINKDEISITDRLGSLPRELTLPNNDLIVIESDSLVDSWLSDGKRDISFFERSPKAVIASIMLVPLAFYFVFAIAIPAMAIAFAPAVPEWVVKQTTQQSMSILERTSLEPSKIDENLQNELKTEWQSLLYEMKLDHQDFTILFRDSDTFGANAFALPDGTIVFTDDLLKLVNYDKDILTAIFVHEVGHVEQHHSIRLIAQSIATSVAISYFFGDISGIFEVFIGTASTITSNQYTQEAEWEADNFALEKLQQTGRNPLDFAAGMQKFSELAPEMSDELQILLSSHPLTEDRIQNALDFSESNLDDLTLYIQNK